MFQLIALVTLKEGAPLDELINQGESFLSSEPNIRRFRIRRDAGMHEQFSIAHASFALICEFDSAEHWRRYVDGDIHERFSSALRPWKVAATVIQFHDTVA